MEFACAVCFAPVATLVSVTDADVKTAPDGSVTVPANSPVVVVCARNSDAETAIHNNNAGRLRLDIFDFLSTVISALCGPDHCGTALRLVPVTAVGGIGVPVQSVSSWHRNIIRTTRIASLPGGNSYG